VTFQCQDADGGAFNGKMLSPGPARKVTIHLNEDTSSGHDFLYKEIFSFLFERGVAGASLIRPQAGFGFHHRLHRTDSSGVNYEHLAVRIEFVETKEIVDSLLPALFELITDGLIEAQDTVILKSAVHSEPI
jgi:PII-like signaling protein